jgi:hypothetical protein
MKKNITLSILFFIFGFFVHALFFPDFMVNGIVDVSQVAGPNTQQGQNQQINDPQFTRITYDGKRFSRNNVSVGFTRYIQIINISEKDQMWLLSDDPELTTPRGYGTSETIQKQFNKKGQYVVIDKNNPQEKLVITVK